MKKYEKLKDKDEKYEGFSGSDLEKTRPNTKQQQCNKLLKKHKKKKTSCIIM